MTPALHVFGLIVLRVDETIEDEFRRYIPPDQARLHITRIPSGDNLTPGTIAEMEGNLTTAAALLPPAARFDVVGYACTSGTAFLGADNVASRVSAGASTRAVTNPLTAAIAQFRARGMHRVGIVSPYTPDVARPLCAAFEAAGITVVDTLSLKECDEARVARIDPALTARAATELAQRSAVDGIFLSCTNLRTHGILAPLSEQLGLPVLSSNHSLAWHMMRLATGT